MRLRFAGRFSLPTAAEGLEQGNARLQPGAAGLSEPIFGIVDRRRQGERDRLSVETARGEAGCFRLFRGTDAFSEIDLSSSR